MSMVKDLLGEILRGDRSARSVADVFYDSYGICITEVDAIIFDHCLYLENLGAVVPEGLGRIAAVCDSLLCSGDLSKVGGIEHLLALYDRPGIAAAIGEAV